MTIGELIQKRIQLEKQINDLIHKFEKETGTQVEEIEEHINGVYNYFTIEIKL